MLDVTPSSGALVVEAPAKVNLTLRILGRRRGGFHDLESVVAAVSLTDRLTFRPADRLHVACADPDVPVGDGNLVARAARALAEATGATAGADVELLKRIPVGRGLGGGSSDAAAALVGLNALWDLGLSRQALVRLGADLGSDVPFFLGTPTAVLRGRGERLQPADTSPRWWLVLGWPDFGLATAEVYAAYDRLPAPAGHRPAATDVLAHLAGPAALAAPLLVNDLERAAWTVRCSIKGLRRVFAEAGAAAVGMTGSGSACFALADTPNEAHRWARAAQAAKCQAVVVQFIGA